MSARLAAQMLRKTPCAKLRLGACFFRGRVLLGLCLAAALLLLFCVADPSVAQLPAALNDTGIVTFGDASRNDLTAEPADYPGQDAGYGRDARAGAGQLTKIGGGAKGFDFTKIANDGSPLPDTAMLGEGAGNWACTRDNVTGLIWEIKSASGLRAQSHRYSWYDSNVTTNGDGAGVASAGRCFAQGRCDTEKYVQDVNAAALCGHNDWRMPSMHELMSIMDYGASPLIDHDWFPDVTAGGSDSPVFWSGSAHASFSSTARNINFSDGFVYNDYKGNASLVRVVRDGTAAGTK